MLRTLEQLGFQLPEQFAVAHADAVTEVVADEQHGQVALLAGLSAGSESAPESTVQCRRGFVADQKARITSAQAIQINRLEIHVKRSTARLGHHIKQVGDDTARFGCRICQLMKADRFGNDVQHAWVQRRTGSWKASESAGPEQFSCFSAFPAVGVRAASVTEPSDGCTGRISPPPWTAEGFTHQPKHFASPMEKLTRLSRPACAVRGQRAQHESAWTQIAPAPANLVCAPKSRRSASGQVSGVAASDVFDVGDQRKAASDVRTARPRSGCV